MFVCEHINNKQGFGSWNMSKVFQNLHMIIVQHVNIYTIVNKVGRANKQLTSFHWISSAYK